MRLSSAIVSIAASLLVLCLGAPQAHATPLTTDTSDLWFNPAESGWGVSINQQAEVIFLAMYVYNASGQPVWYTASDMRFAGTGANDQLVFNGALYTSTGPYFGGPFNPASVTTRQVGNATFSLTNLTTATLAYTVDGVAVTKNLTRMTWRANNMTGNYQGGQLGTNSSCGGNGTDGYLEEPGTWAVSHASDNNATLTFTGTNNTCTYSGQYGQGGKMGLASGNFSCTNGTVGSFQMFAIETQITGLQGRLAYTSNRCAYTGRFGGLRRGP